MGDFKFPDDAPTGSYLYFTDNGGDISFGGVIPIDSDYRVDGKGYGATVYWRSSDDISEMSSISCTTRKGGLWYDRKAHVGELRMVRNE